MAKKKVRKFSYESDDLKWTLIGKIKKYPRNVMSVKMTMPSGQVLYFDAVEIKPK